MTKLPLPPRLLAFLLAALALAGTGSIVREQMSASVASSQLVPTVGNQPLVSPKRVLLVFNAKSSEARALAGEYAQKRKIPEKNIVRLLCPDTDECTRAEYEAAIEPFVRGRALADPALDYVVLVRGVPFRFSDWGAQGGFSIDGALATCLMRPKPTAQINNPYWEANVRFTRAQFRDMLLVTRLDGTTFAQARTLIGSSLGARPVAGPFYLRDSFVMSMKAANDLLAGRKLTTEWIEGFNNGAFPRYQGSGGPFMAHWGAGPHDTQFSEAEFAALRFLPGALCDLTWSTSAAGLRDKTSKGNIAVMTAGGAAGAHGYVSEPFAIAVSKPEIVLERYTRGFNLAESFAMGTPFLHWKDVVLGDPLCAPYAADTKKAP